MGLAVTIISWVGDKVKMRMRERAGKISTSVVRTWCWFFLVPLYDCGKVIFVVLAVNRRMVLTVVLTLLILLLPTC